MHFLLTWLDSCNGWGSSFEVRRLTIQTCDGITCKRQIQIGLVSLMPLDARSPAVRSWRPCPRSILGRWQIARCLPWMCLGCRRLKQTEAGHTLGDMNWHEWYQWGHYQWECHGMSIHIEIMWHLMGIQWDAMRFNTWGWIKTFKTDENWTPSPLCMIIIIIIIMISP